MSKTFLKDAKENLARFEQTRTGMLKIIVGNSACDLDTAVCTLGVAISKRLESAKNDLVLPVFNLGREEMDYKTEVVYCFKNIGISLDDLIYRPDIEDTLNWALRMHKLEVVLVDHHQDAALQSCVVEIFDHHTVQVPIEPIVKTTIKPVGSCSTLVMQHILEKPEILRTFAVHHRDVLELFLGAILLDTVNFDKLVNRFTEADLQTAYAIEMNLSRVPADLKLRRALYSELLAARNDVSFLTPLQQLQRDYKMVGTLPVCGLTTLVQEFVRSFYPGAEKALKEFADMMGSTEVVIIGMSTIDGIVKRDIGFYSNAESPSGMAGPEKRLEDCIAQLKEPNFDLCLLKYPINGFSSIALYWQQNVQLTRKHLIPALKIILDQLYAPSE